MVFLELRRQKGGRESSPPSLRLSLWSKTQKSKTAKARESWTPSVKMKCQDSGLGPALSGLGFSLPHSPSAPSSLSNAWATSASMLACCVRSQSCSFGVCTWAREDHVSSATFRAAQVYQELNPILPGPREAGRQPKWGERGPPQEPPRRLMPDRKSTRLNSSHTLASRMPSSA